MPNLYVDGWNDFGDPVLKKMHQEAVAWLNDIQNDKQPRWLSFTGASGTGKTFLAQKCIRLVRSIPRMMEHKDLINPVLKFYWPTLLNQLRDGQYHLLGDLRIANVVFIDEVKIDHDPTGFAAEKLADLLGWRSRKWAIITSNMTIDEITKLDRRIASRMFRDGSEVINCNTTDYAMRDRKLLGVKV